MVGAKQRQRALANVGSARPRSKGATARRLRSAAGDSHSQGDAVNSENSALTSASSVAAAAGSVTAAAGSVTAAASSASGLTSTPTEGVDLSGYGWYEEYVALSQVYAWRLAAYMAWAASPLVGRQPATLA